MRVSRGVGGQVTCCGFRAPCIYALPSATTNLLTSDENEARENQTPSTIVIPYRDWPQPDRACIRSPIFLLRNFPTSGRQTLRVAL